MGEDEKRVAMVLAFFGGAVTLMGPLPEPWNYVIGIALLIAACVAWFWPKLYARFWRPPPPNPLVREFERTEERERAKRIDAEPLQWDDHFGIEYSAQTSGQVFMRTFIVNGTNRSGREVEVEDLYFVSGTTGKKLQLVVAAGPNDGFLLPKDINPVPPGATLTARAEFNNPTGLLPNELMDEWGDVLFYAVYEGKKHLKRFDRKTVEATFAGFRPKVIGPRITKRD